MPILTDDQKKNGYFNHIGGFPPLSDTDDRINFAREVKDYGGQEKLCIACTQLDSYGYSERDKKRVLNEWLEFLSTETGTLKAIHFNSRVPQVLFDAACCQENLEELRIKWGPVSNLSALEKPKKLRFLYIGSGASVQDISLLGKLSTLVVLYLKNFKRIEDYSALAKLENLEQLIISGPTLALVKIKDLEFLREMPNLLSFWRPNTTIRKKYTQGELDALCEALPNLTFVYDSGL